MVAGEINQDDIASVSVLKGPQRRHFMELVQQMVRS
jgi:hypothetical protein